MRKVSDLGLKASKIADKDVLWSAAQQVPEGGRDLAEDLLVGACTEAIRGYAELNPTAYELKEADGVLHLTLK